MKCPRCGSEITDKSLFRDICREYYYFSNYPFAELTSLDTKSCLRFCSYGYEYANITSRDDDWHMSYLLLTLPSFRHEINEAIYVGNHIVWCIKELHKFLDCEIKKVSFEPYEPYFGINLSLKARKRVIVKGFAGNPDIRNGPKLKYEFESDISIIDKFTKGLESIIAKYPTRVLRLPER